MNAMPATNTFRTTDIKLPLQYILAGLIAFFLGQAVLLWDGISFVEGNYRSPLMLGTVHLLMIGWGTMVAMGAMYQLVPVVFQVDIHSMKWGHWQFYFMLVALAGFAYAFISSHFTLLFICGILLVLTFAMFLINMTFSLRAVFERNILYQFVLSSLICLTLTVLLGLFLVLNMTMGWLPGQWHMPILYAHITLGIAGWFTLLIFGFSYKMVPMFSLSHGYSMDLANVVFYVYHGGLLFTLVAYLTASQLLLLVGAVLLAVGFITFAVHIRTIVKKGMKKELDVGFRYALYGIGGGNAAFILFALWTFLEAAQMSAGSSQQWMIAVVYFSFMGWISLCILGYLYKIVPFLWWTHAFSSKIGKQGVPTLMDMISEKAGKWLFPLFSMSIVTVTIAIMTQIDFLFYVGQGVLTVTSLFYVVTVMKVLTTR